MECLHGFLAAFPDHIHSHRIATFSSKSNKCESTGEIHFDR